MQSKYISQTELQALSPLETLVSVDKDRRELKSIQFAGDMNLFSVFQEKFLQSAINTLKVFESNTGLKLNYDKSNVYQIGSLKHSCAKLETFKPRPWTNESIQVLSIEIDHDHKKMKIKNYEGIVEKIIGITQTWTNRYLSLQGNVILTNSLIGSLFVYTMTVLRNVRKKPYTRDYDNNK